MSDMPESRTGITTVPPPAGRSFASFHITNHQYLADVCAVASYRYADAMLKARAK